MVAEPGAAFRPARFAMAAGICLAMLGAVPATGQTVGLSPIETLHRNLQLSAAQETAWKAYRAQADPPGGTEGRRRAAAQMFPTLNAPQRMDLVTAELRQELADLDHQSQALKAFYATLNAEQQRVFDDQTLPPADKGQPAP